MDRSGNFDIEASGYIDKRCLPVPYFLFKYMVAPASVLGIRGIKFKSYKCNHIKTFPTMSLLKYLSIHCYKINNYEFLMSLPNLVGLSISGDNKGYNLKEPIGMDKLQYLNIGCTDNGFNYDGLNEVKSLTVERTRMKNLNSISHMALFNFMFFDTSNLVTLDGLNVKNLMTLDLRGCRNLNNINALSAARNIHYLNIDGCKKIKNISNLSDISSLKILEMSDCGEIYSLDPIKKLNNIEVIDLSGDTNVVDGKVKFLRYLKNIKKINYGNKSHYDDRIIY